MTEYRTYLAAPVGLLQDPEWPVLVENITSMVGPVWDPTELFRSTAEWLERWPVLLPFVRDLVLVPDFDGSIGAGCLQEIAGVLGHDRLVRAYLRQQLVPWWDLVIQPVPVPTRFRVALICQQSSLGVHEDG